MMADGLLLELLDTSLKVGLGALVAGLAGWLSWRHHQAVGSLSGPEHRRLTLLESLSGQVGQVTHGFARYTALVAQAAQYGDRWPQAQRQEFERVNQRLVELFAKLAEAESTLLMLGEKNLERALRIYGGKIALYRQQVYPGRPDLPAEQLTQLKQEVTQAREHFYDILSRKYDRLLVKAS